MYYEVGTPTRIYVVSNRYKLAEIINRYNGKIDLHRSVYAYGSLLQKGERFVIDPDTIIAEWLFFDIDTPSMDQIRPFFKGKIGEVKKITKMTGQGFHALLSIKNNLEDPSEAVGSAQVTVAEKLGVDLKVEDDNKSNNITTIGNLRQMTRILNTWNIHRGRYCIPIIKEDMDKSYEEILELSKKQRFVSAVSGEKKLDISDYDRRGYLKVVNGYGSKLKYNPDIVRKSENVLKELRISSDMVCRFIKRMMSSDADFKQRNYIIIYCRDKLKLTIDETSLLLYNMLSPQKWRHCIDHDDIVRMYTKVKLNNGREKWRYSYSNFCSGCYTLNCELRYC